ncbi:VWA domain-containing protein [Permianibacter sp. IMCC34836]|uniref:vWA domain-containing protein n=1 Tax=Permianibacter fluminis TaxID=2738515 RepID=UPI00155537B6|nr:VWA domain-containing protein [Permianibacter fluminis]NQD38661.1 VWA domain-containing protein [Permianibacter fluminis]
MLESGFDFALPWLLLALPLPLLIRARHPALQGSALWLPFFSRWQQLANSEQPTRDPRRRLLLWLIWLLLVLAAAQPRWVGEPISQPRSGRDLMLVIDVSGSMEATDLPLNGAPASRLDVLKQVVGEFIERRTGDRLGLVLFGERAYLQAPLSFDRKTVRQFLSESEIGLAGAQRTAIGDGMAMALKHLHDSPAKRRAMILVTDGANNAGSLTPEQATTLAKDETVTVYTIGVGADEMVVNDWPFGKRRVNPSAELDEDALKAIASATGGEYFRARDQDALAQIYQLLDQLEPAASDADAVRPQTALFYWPLLLAFALALWRWLVLLWPPRRAAT